MPGRALLVSPSQVRSIVEHFKFVYPNMGSPRFLISVNRELVDDLAGMKFFPGKEKSGAARNSSSLVVDPNLKTDSTPSEDDESVISPFPGSLQNQALASATESRYPLRDRDIPTLADKITAKDVERIFARTLRSGGARLSEPSSPAQLVGDSILKSVTAPAEDEAARKNRDALKKIADVVVEILIAPRKVPLPGQVEAKTYVVPDLQATAVRLSDSKVIGQVASSDILGRVYSYANRILELPEITEVTALALMEDMMMNAR